MNDESKDDLRKRIASSFEKAKAFYNDLGEQTGNVKLDESAIDALSRLVYTKIDATMICVFAAKLIYASAEAKSSTPENPYVVTEKDLRRLGVTGPNYAVWASDLEKKATLKSEEYASSIEAARRNLKKQH